MKNERKENILARRKDRVSPDSIDFFVSIMLRYPEIATVKYDPGRCRVKFTFILSEIISSLEQNKFNDILFKALETYYQLEGKKAPEIALVVTTCDKITLIEIGRDVHSLCPNEIGIMVEVFRESFGQIAVVDSNLVVEEDLLYREEIIKHTLESLKKDQLVKRLIALREEGRVLVFNK
jgi:hypothetical protein